MTASSRRRGILAGLEFVALALLAMDVELFATDALLETPPDYLRAAALHGAVTGGLLLWGLLRLRGERTGEAGDSQYAAWRLLLAGGVGLLGIAGAAAALAGWIAWRLYRMRSTPFEEWYEQLFPERHHDLAERLYDELMRMVEIEQDGSKVVPFMDVIAHGSRGQKHLAIGVMSRNFQPSFAPALRHALKDADNSVRVQAATAIAGIENRFLENALQLEDRVRRNPRANALVELARHYDRYAFCGLLDEERELRNRERALETYRRYLQMHPEDVEARVAVGRLLLRMGQAEEAARWLHETREHSGSTPRLDAWYMEALFRLGRYAELREVARADARSVVRDAGMPQVLQSSTDLWARGPHAREAS